MFATTAFTHLLHIVVIRLAVDHGIGQGCELVQISRALRRANVEHNLAKLILQLADMLQRGRKIDILLVAELRLDQPCFLDTIHHVLHAQCDLAFGGRTEQRCPEVRYNGTTCARKDFQELLLKKS